MHLDDESPTGTVLCGYDVGDGNSCEICDKEAREYEESIRKQERERILKEIDKIFEEVDYGFHTQFSPDEVDQILFDLKEKLRERISK